MGKLNSNLDSLLNISSIKQKCLKTEIDIKKHKMRSEMNDNLNPSFDEETLDDDIEALLED